MYIGPWQEYKLAQVIKLKNDLYEGNSQNRSLRHTTTQDNISLSQCSNASTPSTRTLSSEPIQKPYPKFAIDQYYEQWRKVEHIMSQPTETHKKPPLPKVQVRKRQGKSIHEKRVNQMRNLYGLNRPNTEVPINENQKISFADKLKNRVKESEKLIEKPIEKFKRELGIGKVEVVESFRGKIEDRGEEEEEKKELEVVERKKHEGGNGKTGLRDKDKWNLRISTIGEAKKEVPYKVEEKFTPETEDNNKKFTCLVSINELDALEESINHDAIDGLLQWVDNLPDEASSTLRDLSNQDNKFSGIKI